MPSSLWAGRIISALASLFLLFDATIHVLNIAPVVAAFAQLGYPDSLVCRSRSSRQNLARLLAQLFVALRSQRYGVAPSSLLDLSQNPSRSFGTNFGSGTLAAGIGIVEFGCLALYIIPRTAILGGILLTGYLGGATAAQVRIGGPYLFSIAIGILVWAGLFFQDDQLRRLLPVRRLPIR